MARNYFSIFVLILLLTSCSTKKSLLSSSELKRMNYQEVKGLYDTRNPVNPKPDLFPMYPNGLQGLMKDVGTNIRYPESKRQGEVIVKYIIERNGSIQEIEIERSVSKELDEEAIRVIRKLKTWHPGFKDNEPVRVQFRQSIKFQLQ